MPIRVALHHVTQYLYDRPFSWGADYSASSGRRIAHAVLPIRSMSNHPSSFSIGSRIHLVTSRPGSFSRRHARAQSHGRPIAEMTVINPFDFFVEEYGTEFPFKYDPDLAKDLKPFLDPRPIARCSRLTSAGIDVRPRRTIYFWSI